MQRVSIAKTKSAPRIWRAGFVLALCVTALVYSYSRAHVAANCGVLSTNGRCISVTIAKTPASQERGLGGRTSLAPNEGMLFVFDGMAQRCFWMKDMRIPIDMVWLNASGRITAIEANVKPDTYPQQYCYDGYYVLEVAAGQASAHMMRPGDVLRISD